MRLINRVGQRYERLVVISRAPNASETDTNARWNCRCDCGRMVVAYGQDLQKGKVKSCGCLNAQRIFKHGLSRTKPYRIWKHIHQRCGNENNAGYGNYGGRGIAVDPRWNDFEVFIADMGFPEKDQSLDRIDNNGPYCKENCRWATPKMQLNNKRNNCVVEAFGEKKTISEWADRTGIKWSTIRARIFNYGWSAEKALTEPIRPGLALSKRKQTNDYKYVEPGGC